MTVLARLYALKWVLAALLALAGAYLLAGGEPAFAAFGVALLLAVLLLAPIADARARAPGSGAAARADALADIAAVRHIVAALPDAAFLLRADGRVLMHNDKAAEIVGVVPPGRPVTMLLRAPEIAQALRSVRGGGGPLEVSYLEHGAVARRFAATLTPLGQDDHGPGPPPDAGTLLLTLRDMTHEQQVERMRADFVANASHELRTPLASLAGFVETLRGPARDDAEARERFLDIMHTQAWRMSRLIDDLLSLSRIELNAHIRPRDRVDLVETVAFVIDSMTPLARGEGVEIVFRHDDTAVAPVRGDRDELMQLFQNLVENAVKYGGGRVEITLRHEPAFDGAPCYAVTVGDDGPGIAAHDLPRLTERFYRVDAASSRAKGGTGLGLAIVKHILSRHRGAMDIRSTPGEGAEFEVLLPGADAPPGAVVPTGVRAGAKAAPGAPGAAPHKP